ncbi:MAG TPA: hypothetical protein VFU46_11510 [Gemmatimonadales bacterium]|nr:hypothetical protein [Gemmatimonadales bacterium]
MRPVKTLLHGLIDYAGLFPPAGLGMAAAVAEYAAHRSGPWCWALGRFVVPAARLGEFERAAEPCFPASGLPWKVSALGGPDLEAELTIIDGFNARRAGHAAVDTIELKAACEAAAAAALGAIDRRLDAFVEIPVAQDPGALVAALARLGARAKVRTGGVTADAFPSAADLLRFIRRCNEARVPFKATAGLHHPLRGEYALTYAPDSARGTMFGFLNVFLATALLVAGADVATARAMLDERDPRALTFTDDGVTWRDRSLTSAQLGAARELAIASFGSCSFREPIDDLSALGML